MKRLISILLLSQLALLGCIGHKSSNDLKQDSINSAKAKQDSIKKVTDSIANVRRIDTLNAIGLKNLALSDSTCQSIASALSRNLIQDPRDYIVFIAKLLECNDRDWNQNHPSDPVLTTMSEGPDNKVLFNTMSAKTAEQIAEISKHVITVAIAYNTGDPILTSLGTVAGNYTVNTYLEAAKKNDPLILIYPTAVPQVKLGKDALKISEGAFKEISKLHIDKPFTIQLQAGKTIANVALISVEAAKNYIIKDGIATLKNGVKLPVVGNGPLNPTNLKSPVGPLGPLGPIIGKLL